MTILATLNKTRLAFLATFAFLLVSQQLNDPDYFWHLKTGEYIVTHGALPAGDIFSSTRFGQAWVLHEWLFEAGLYGMFAWLGPFGVRLLTVTLGMAALGLVFLLTRRLGRSPALACALMLAAFIPFGGGIAPRPQLLTYVLFAIYLSLLLRYKYARPRPSARTLLPLPPLMVVWVNAHGGYAIGIALAVLFTACEWLAYASAAARDPGQRRRLIRLTQATCACVLASLANPGFLEQWRYPFQVLGMAANRAIQEWQSPNFHELAYQVYLLLCLLFFLSYLYARRKPDLTELVLPGFFLVNGFIAVRHIPLAVLTILPFTALAFARGADAAWAVAWRRSKLARWQARQHAAGRQLGRAECVLNWIVLGAVVAGLMIGAPVLRAAEEQKTGAMLPVGAAAFVAANGITGRMFNSYNYGGYLIYRLGPHWKVLIDGRVDVYGDQFFADFLGIYTGQANWKEKFDQLSIDFAIVGKDAPIRQLLLANASFKEVYLDRRHSVLLRDIPRHRAWLGKPLDSVPSRALID